MTTTTREGAASGPTLGHGKICYLEIPVRTGADVERSAAFYREVFGWHVRKRGDGAVAFDDAVGQVSGTWKPGGAPAGDPAINIYIMVADMSATLVKVAEHGGTVVRPIDPGSPVLTAHYRDPAGNVFGLYQDETLARSADR